MTDIVDSKRRSELMAGIRGRDTAPELAVRRMAHRMGLRFRLHRKDLPGSPDLVFPRHRLALFVHGCFWHQHEGCSIAHIPKTRSAYWTEKFEGNVARDKRNQEALQALGWRVAVIWECETGDPDGLKRKITAAICGDTACSTKEKLNGGHMRTVGVAGGAAQTATPPLFVDAFAGCGGLSLGLKRAGWKGLFAIEKDRFAFETLSANFLAGDGSYSYNWPENIEEKAWDIHELLSKRREALACLEGKIDLLAGGPPCQGVSHAGRREHDDPRNMLFEAYLELVGILRPRLVLVENVRGIQADFKASECFEAKNFATILQRGLGTDYDIESTIIKASDFGIPQTRPRYFLVGARKHIAVGDRVATFFKDLERQTEGFLAQRQLPRRPTAKDAIGDLEVARNGRVSSVDSKGFEAIGYNGPQTRYQTVMRDGHEGAPSDTRLARHRPHIRDRFEDIIKACRKKGRLNVTISAEIREEHGLKKMAIRVLDPLGSAPTITSLPDDLLHYSEPRTLTVRENARLQSFPDWFAFKGKYTTGGHLRRNEVPRFTQVANAVPPLLAEQLGLLLLKILFRVRDTEFSVQGAADSSQCGSVSPQLPTELLHPPVINNDISSIAPDRP